MGPFWIYSSASSIRPQTPTAILMRDVDHFKIQEDSYLKTPFHSN